MSDWNFLHVMSGLRAGNFRGNRSLAMRSLSRGAGSKPCARIWSENQLKKFTGLWSGFGGAEEGRLA